VHRLGSAVALLLAGELALLAFVLAVSSLSWLRCRWHVPRGTGRTTGPPGPTVRRPDPHRPTCSAKWAGP
jgi:hypothetical protein